MEEITVHLTKEQKDALYNMADNELRNPRTQAAYLIILGLSQAGYINPPNNPLHPTPAPDAGAGEL